MKKEKRKKKRITLLLFVLICIFASSSLFYHKSIKTEGNNQQEKTQDEITEACQKIDYCNEEYLTRYQNYYQQNKDLTKEEVITRVNIGLDYSFYTHTKDAPYLNKNYILVNKYYHVGQDYIPENLETITKEYARSGMMLVQEAKEAFEQMAEDAKKENITIIAMSSYRSYEYQLNLYNNYVEKDGVQEADTYSARAGYSEHQTGLSVDIYDGKIDYTNFESTDSFQWMQENADQYGFILRFPKGKEDITGYQYEAWHYRYVGKEIANYIKKNNITFEEYYAKFIEGKK